MHKLQNSFVYLMFFLVISSCNMKKEIDTILYNGTIYLVDESFSSAGAIAVDKGIVLKTGNYQTLTNKYKPAEEIDLQGKFVYPGFYDAHCHFLGYGLNLNQADLTGTRSFDEVIARLKEFQKDNTSSWIIGRGWDQNDWENTSFPKKDMLDIEFPNTPVFLTRIDGHAALVNSVTLDVSGITAQTEVQGGQILTENGELTGILIDKAIDLVTSKIPIPGWEQKKAALLNAQEKCVAVGLTSVADAGLELEDIQIIQAIHSDNSLQMRIYAMLSPSEENIEQIVKKGKIQTSRLTVSSIKLFADGALGSRGALLLEPYSDDPGNTGLQIHETDYYKKICQLAYDYGYQVNTHCIGDSANRLMLSMYAGFLKGKNDRRWRIEHAQIVHPDDFNYFANFSIIPSVQSTHATSDMYWAEERLGPERMQGAYDYQRLLKQNGWIVNGSDFPVESINPLLGFYAAVARQDTDGYPEKGFQTEGKLTREQALRAMTIWAAKAAFEEHLKGSLETGKVADFVVLNKDLMEMDLSEIPQLEVQQTYIDGKSVYSR